MVVITMMIVVVVVVIKLRSAKIRINGVKAVARPVGSLDMETISNDSNSYEMVVEINIITIIIIHNHYYHNVHQHSHQ